jgi:hypothetical protein
VAKQGLEQFRLLVKWLGDTRAGRFANLGSGYPVDLTRFGLPGFLDRPGLG